MLKEINATSISLLSKTQTAGKLTDYIPISCCNTLYKCVSKIFANRLSACLPSFISINQSAFVKGRRIADNLLLAYELVGNHHRSTISSRCALKVDLMKAFDSVDRNFLLNVLHAMNFPGNFITWIHSSFYGQIFNFNKWFCLWLLL